MVKYKRLKEEDKFKAETFTSPYMQGHISPTPEMLDTINLWLDSLIWGEEVKGDDDENYEPRNINRLKDHIFFYLMDSGILGDNPIMGLDPATDNAKITMLVSRSSNPQTLRVIRDGVERAYYEGFNILTVPKGETITKERILKALKDFFPPEEKKKKTPTCKTCPWFKPWGIKREEKTGRCIFNPRVETKNLGDCCHNHPDTKEKKNNE